MAFARSFFRPLDKTESMIIEVFTKARFQPFSWIREPIKIKVIAV
jgi:hypothetical protein